MNYFISLVILAFSSYFAVTKGRVAISNVAPLNEITPRMSFIPDLDVFSVSWSSPFAGKVCFENSNGQYVLCKKSLSIFGSTGVNIVFFYGIPTRYDRFKVSTDSEGNQLTKNFFVAKPTKISIKFNKAWTLLYSRVTVTWEIEDLMPNELCLKGPVKKRWECKAGSTKATVQTRKVRLEHRTKYEFKVVATKDNISTTKFATLKT